MILTIKSPSPTQSRILDALIGAGGRILKSDLVDKVYPDPDNAPMDELQTISVHINKIKKILKPEISIKTVCGHYAIYGVKELNKGSGFPIITELTVSEALILSILLDRRWHSDEFIWSVLYTQRRLPKNPKYVIQVFVCGLRKKLRKEFRIETLHEEYRLNVMEYYDE